MSKRSKYFATIQYDDSSDIEYIIRVLDEEFHISALISPLHDKDILPTGEPKKAHRHIILIFDSLKSLDQAKEIVSCIGTVGCQLLTSFRGYARYLCHLDSPDKYLYDKDLVLNVGDVDYWEVISSSADLMRLHMDICDFCYSNKVFDYWYLVQFSSFNGKCDWFKALQSQALFYRVFLRSLENMYNKYGFLPDFHFDIESDRKIMDQLRDVEKDLKSDTTRDQVEYFKRYRAIENKLKRK